MLIFYCYLFLRSFYIHNLSVFINKIYMCTDYNFQSFIYSFKIKSLVFFERGKKSKQNM